MDAWQLALFGVLLYWLIAGFLDRRGHVPGWISLSGPLTTLHTQRGKVLLDRMAERDRFWRAWANVGVGIALVVMLGAFFIVVFSALLTLQNPSPTAVNQPRNVLVIPGLNDFLPLSAAPYIVAALVIGLVVHEGGHGLLCRVEDIDIESLGLVFLAYVPMGAFVEPDQESQAEAGRGSRARMFAAGVTNNFAITVLAFALLFGPVAGSIAVTDGAHVGVTLPDSPADEADIGAGDRILAVNGEAVGKRDELQSALAANSSRTVRLEVAGRGDVVVEREVFVTSAAEETDIEAGTRITAVDGLEVNTVPAYRAALRDAGERSTLTLVDGSNRSNHTITVGPRVRVVPGGGLAQAGAEARSDLAIVAVDGERVRDPAELGAAIDRHQPGDVVAVEAYRGDQRVTYEAELGGSGDDPLLGLRVYPELAGVAVDDLGIQYYPSEQYLAVLGGDPSTSGLDPGLLDSFLGKLLIVLMLPFASVGFGGVLPYNFPGFVDPVTDFYAVEGPLGFMGGTVFTLANLLFWIGWLNFNLGLFNLIPAFPLDGGHILRTSTESIVSRLPISNSYAATKIVTVAVGLSMGLSLLGIVAIPQLLG